ncbi:MAG: Na(+)-translocating NADH-quinone reductase subunit A [Gammaproteobacteria bacterium]|nr:Na(+)-translocating NADH-quinone reductase subunit A [Gammaproteobacteria bacterium]
MIKIKKGLDIPISGEPEQRIYAATAVSQVAVVGRDFIGLKPKMLVAVDDQVKLGQPLFEDRRNPGVVFASPGSGKIIAINRGERRILQSVVVKLDDPENDADFVEFKSYKSEELDKLNSEKIRSQLLESGLWVALRSRPFNKVVKVGSTPAAIFVNAMDTNPLAADAELLIQDEAAAFADGLKVICGLADVPVHMCKAPATNIPTCAAANLQVHEFAGPHPAGLAGTHIHHLEPVTASRIVWTINYQDVIAVGKLFTTGKLSTKRIVSLAGPLVEKPRLLETRWGAYIPELIVDEVPKVKARILAGSVLIGRRAVGWGAYLGRNHYQICALAEGGEREFISWIRPGSDKFSATRVFISKLMGRKKFAMSTLANGSDRAMVPIGMYEAVVPQDFLVTHLLRALLVKDTVMAQQLGCLELVEEDMSLCSFVCPSKYDYGPILRENLELIEKEG